jgi:hypothetical protein
VDRRLLGEVRREIHLGELLRVERPRPLLQHVRPGKRLLHRHLLVDRESDQ